MAASDDGGGGRDRLEWTATASPAASKGATMKLMSSLIAAAYLMCGCVAGSTIPHDDSPGAVAHDSGPALCRDGTTPPCNDRD
jgi:hypothetical protein